MRIGPAVLIVLTTALAACSPATDEATYGKDEQRPGPGAVDGTPNHDRDAVFATVECPLMGPPTVVRFQRVVEGERVYSVQLYNDHRDRLARKECADVLPLASTVVLSYRLSG